MQASSKEVYGFTGRILRVDLSRREVAVDTPPVAIYRRYGGCGGLAAYYLLRELPAGLDPFHPDSLLVIMTGPLCGTPLWGANRFLAASKSPLTMSYAESEAGGWWGPELKFAGYDGIIIRGRADHPVYLLVADGAVEIRDARRLWGRLTGEVQESLEAELGDRRVRVLQCGPAGEKRVRFASITNELRHWLGRCGLGAVMASKNLRAIVTRGHGKVAVADQARAMAVLQWLRQNFRRAESTMHLHGTARGVRGLNADGILPTRNFREGSFEHAEALAGETMTATILTGRGSCYACAIACKREVSVPELGVVPTYGGPEYETIAALGSLCGIGDLKLVAKGNQLCGQYGLDTISTGAAIAFAMECYEKGLLTPDDTGGIELRFGNGEAMLRTIELIARREGLGDLLAEGVARAAKLIGKGAERFAMHVKGQEVPMHEPRGKVGLSLSYALSPTGADHMEAPHDPFLETLGSDKHALSPLGLLEPLDRLDFSPRKVRAYYLLQLLWGMYNVIGMCKFAAVPIGPLTLPKLVEFHSAVTGWETSSWELLRLAQRASTMYRAFNCREGLGPNDDTLPRRFFEALEGGALKGQRLDPIAFENAKRLFYELSGWDPDTGEPTRATLAALELEWLL